MKKEAYEAFMKQQNKNLQEQGVRIKPPVCTECGEPMVNGIDSITKRRAKFF